MSDFNALEWADRLAHELNWCLQPSWVLGGRKEVEAMATERVQRMHAVAELLRQYQQERNDAELAK